MRVFIGNGDNTFQGAIVFGVSLGAGDIKLGDFDNDGKLDLVVATESAGTIAFAKGVGDGNFIAPAAFPVASPYGVVVADIDKDGNLDLVVGSAGVAFMRGRGDGTFEPPNTMHASLGRVYVMATGDVNGDGWADVAVVSGGTVKVLYNRGMP